jgi:phage gpG-like protein
MAETLKQQVNKLFKGLYAVSDDITPALMSRIGFTISVRIKRRTRSGTDVNGRPFKIYNERYSITKRMRGHPSTVNLSDTGTIMKSMSVNSTAREATIFFLSENEAYKAQTHHDGIGKMPKREFFSMNKSDEDVVEKMILNAIHKRVKLT